MLTALTLAQVGVAAVVLALVAERLWHLCWRSPLSPELSQQLRAALRHAPAGALVSLLSERPLSHAARIVGEAGSAEPDLDELVAVLRADATDRLVALRVLATVSSTLGLLTAIVCLSAGFDPESAGLVALEAGKPERLAMARALTAMASGVGCSAVCFYALGRLRPLAARLLNDDARLVRALRGP